MLNFTGTLRVRVISITIISLSLYQNKSGVEKFIVPVSTPQRRDGKYKDNILISLSVLRLMYKNSGIFT